jgi:hypothetical protein
MHSQEYIIAGMHSLECIPKIEDPNAALVALNTKNIYIFILFYYYFFYNRKLSLRKQNYKKNNKDLTSDPLNKLTKSKKAQNLHQIITITNISGTNQQVHV